LVWTRSSIPFGRTDPSIRDLVLGAGLKPKVRDIGFKVF
jgi:hypothetical protein